MKPFVAALTLAIACLTVPPPLRAQGLGDGSPCRFNRDCLSRKCRGGHNKRCQGPPLLPSGASCTRNVECSSGKCRGGHNKRCQGD
jgi:hypothetical protein